MTPEEYAFFKKQLDSMKVVPSSVADATADYHLCPSTSQRQYHNYPEFVTNYCVCNVPVYFIDAAPNRPKICFACAMKRNPDGMDSLVTPDTLAKIAFPGNRN